MSNIFSTIGDIYTKLYSLIGNFCSFIMMHLVLYRIENVVIAVVFNEDLLTLNNAQVIISDACKFVNMNASSGLQNLI